MKIYLIIMAVYLGLLWLGSLMLVVNSKSPKDTQVNTILAIINTMLIVYTSLAIKWTFWP